MAKTDEERYYQALMDIGLHFDDQSFPPHLMEDCPEILVNFAIAVINGYDGYMSDWFETQYKK